MHYCKSFWVRSTVHHDEVRAEILSGRCHNYVTYLKHPGHHTHPHCTLELRFLVFG